ncbi:MAG: type 4a pilus biogenesis protein PilO [Candidatus Omnitrophica bacterium]|nr:type 4a pilus biogenesis protein PilO [Candidatus Omnitrophota bacterium]MBU4590035.1 type 4a pilus biogenesis protein PilO [Candidatus Omnitrophota bacterium]
MDPKEKQKLYVLFGIFAIAGVMFYYNLLLKPQFSKFLVINKEYGAIKARLRSAEVLIANEAGIKKQHENLSRETAALEQRLPAQDEISNLLGDFSRVAESSGVKILKVKPLEDAGGAAEANGIYAEFPILIEARGGYHQLGSFINRLEGMDRFIDIEDIDINGRTGDPRRHDAKLRVITYIVK